MSKVYVFIKELLQEEIDALLLLLQAAGISEDRIELVDEVEAAKDGCEDDVYVFLLTPATIGSVVAQEAISKVPDGGRRAVCVWPEAAAVDTALPAAIENFSYSTVSWKSPKLGPVIMEVDTTCLETPSGDPVPQPDFERNECE
jgi:hypothetical protein